MSIITRRQFAASTAALATTSLLNKRSIAQVGANDRIVLAVMGTNGRGAALARGFTQQKNATVAYVCDCDERAIGNGIRAVTSAGGSDPNGIADFRRALEDPNVDALVCAAPNHWHAPATILACNAGKHVYVEKPCSHTPQEGEWMVQAARNHDRVVQMGTQRRSAPIYRELVSKLHDGIIGDVLYSKSWYHNRRGSIGKGNVTAVPSWLDYELWQGPTTQKPYRSNVVHYNWHWFWHWGNGELGNNGVHSIDVCRWGLGVDFPDKVSVNGGRIRFDDDQQTPDTLTATYTFGNRVIVWEGVSWSSQNHGLGNFGIEFRGEDGTVLAGDKGYKVFDPLGDLRDEDSGGIGDAPHLVDFLSAIRDGRRPHADIEEAHKSTLLCHLGNIAYRTGQSLSIDPKTGRINADDHSQTLWDKKYRDGWRPTV